MGLFDGVKPFPDEDDEKYAKGLPRKIGYTKTEAQFLAPQLLKQVRESVNLINSTTNPDVFFERYGFAIYRLKELAKMERHVKLSGDRPSVFLVTMRQKKQSAIHNLIDRIYDKADQKLTATKTDKSKLSNIEKIEKQLELYFDQMDKSTINYLNQKLSLLKQKHIKQ
ncbi:MAG: hypothetical protein K5695_12700 [Oscillospiraceae bacterium]|nr:hypothetical protein [Oscillospiraceae bacterium]